MYSEILHLKPLHCFYFFNWGHGYLKALAILLQPFALWRSITSTFKVLGISLFCSESNMLTLNFLPASTYCSKRLIIVSSSSLLFSFRDHGEGPQWVKAYMNICGFCTVLKSTLARLWSCSGTFPYTFHVLSALGLDPFASQPSSQQIELSPPHIILSYSYLNKYFFCAVTKNLTYCLCNIFSHWL